jgi:ribonucleotide monophosphatase NagD (HAD superfamily)
MDVPIKLRGITDIINMYDIFLLDQFGVLHDGKNAIPGAIEVLNEIKRKKNKTCIIVSNSSQRSKFTLNRFYNLGFHEDVVCDAITSGESTYKYLKESNKYIGERS